MSADIYYAIGATHQVCQDYALANGEYAIISDGCSSAKDSDWGARLLAKDFNTIVKQQAKPLVVDYPLLQQVLTLAWTHTMGLNLNEDCLAATLGAVYNTKDAINAFMYGDGYIIAKEKGSKKLLVIEHTFESGAPYYLYYNLRSDLKDSYFNHFGSGKFLIRRLLYDGDNLIDAKSECQTPDYGVQFLQYTFPTSIYDAVGVTSDGLGTFVQQLKGNTSITNKSLKVIDVVNGLFDFKSTTGQFVHRRCQKLMRDYHTQNVKHNDDFSIGVVTCGQ